MIVEIFRQNRMEFRDPFFIDRADVTAPAEPPGPPAVSHRAAVTSFQGLVGDEIRTATTPFGAHALGGKKIQ